MHNSSSLSTVLPPCLLLHSLNLFPSTLLCPAQKHLSGLSHSCACVPYPSYHYFVHITDLPSPYTCSAETKWAVCVSHNYTSNIFYAFAHLDIVKWSSSASINVFIGRFFLQLRSVTSKVGDPLIGSQRAAPTVYMFLSSLCFCCPVTLFLHLPPPHSLSLGLCLCSLWCNWFSHP